MKNKHNIFAQPKDAKFDDARTETKLALRNEQRKKKFLESLQKKDIISYSSDYGVQRSDFADLNFQGDIFDVPVAQLKADPSLKLLKLFVYTLAQLTVNGTKDEIKKKLACMAEEKINFLLQLVYNDKTDFKIKYDLFCFLINILVDTNRFNDTFVENSEGIYSRIIEILNSRTTNEQTLMELNHLEWLFSNMIDDRTMYKKITENGSINVPSMIMFIHDYNTQICNNNPSLFKTNLWLLDIFLEKIELSLYFQYKPFIKCLNDLVLFSIKEQNIDLLNETFEVLNTFSSSVECVEYFLNCKEMTIIQCIMKYYYVSKKAQKLLARILTKDEHDYVSKHYDILGLVIKVLNIDEGINDSTVKNVLWLLCNFIDCSSSQLETVNKIVYDKQMVNLLQRTYVGRDSWEVKEGVVEVYDKLFTEGGLDIKNKFVEMKLHVFLVNELKKFQVQLLTEPECDLINKILLLIDNLLSYSESLNNKINYISKDLENEDLLEVLNAFQECKSDKVYDPAVEILQTYYNEN